MHSSLDPAEIAKRTRAALQYGIMPAGESASETLLTGKMVSSLKKLCTDRNLNFVLSVAPRYTAVAILDSKDNLLYDEQNGKTSTALVEAVCWLDLYNQPY